MKKRASFIFISLLISGSFLMVQTSGCSTSGTGGGGNIFDTVAATWITAFWVSAKTEGPSDRKDIEPPISEIGGRCPASSVALLYDWTNCDGPFSELNVRNNCEILITLYICAAKGSLIQPGDQLQECATDPLDTPLSRLLVVPLNNGCFGDYISASKPLDISIFFCGPDETLVDGPIECLSF